MAGMLDVFEDEARDLALLERLRLPAREERPMPVPDEYRTGPVGEWLLSDDLLRGKLWRHQALALEAFAAGNNVVLSTGTASGKSLVFPLIPDKVRLPTGGIMLNADQVSRFGGYCEFTSQVHGASAQRSAWTSLI